MMINADNTGWATFATAFGLVTVSDLAGQFVMSIFTMVFGIVAAHFVRRYLHRHWPQQPKRRRKRKPAPTE